MRQNVFFCFLEDSLGIRLRDLIGVERLLWGSDYPHVESTWPRSRELLETKILDGCTPEEKRLIVSENVCRIYNFS